MSAIQVLPADLVNKLEADPYRLGDPIGLAEPTDGLDRVEFIDVTACLHDNDLHAWT